MPRSREEQLEERLLAIHKRLAWIANKEERAAWIQGYGAQGQFGILDELSSHSPRRVGARRGR
jgi:hypothetical protein